MTSSALVTCRSLQYFTFSRKSPVSWPLGELHHGSMSYSIFQSLLADAPCGNFANAHSWTCFISVFNVLLFYLCLIETPPINTVCNGMLVPESALVLIQAKINKTLLFTFKPK